jgi:DNA-directed RNA polymerase specialized sigma24 family protein
MIAAMTAALAPQRPDVALVAIERRCARRLERYARKLSDGDQDELDDLLQEARIRAWDMGLGRFDLEVPEDQQFLMRAMNNRMKDVVRLRPWWTDHDQLPTLDEEE